MKHGTMILGVTAGALFGGVIVGSAWLLAHTFYAPKNEPPTQISEALMERTMEPRTPTRSESYPVRRFLTPPVEAYDNYSYVFGFNATAATTTNGFPEYGSIVLDPYKRDVSYNSEARLNDHLFRVHIYDETKTLYETLTRLQKATYAKDVALFDKVCEVKTDTLNGVPYYFFSYRNEAYYNFLTERFESAPGDQDVLLFCGFSRYSLVDGFIIEERYLPLSEHTVTLIPGSISIERSYLTPR